MSDSEAREMAIQLLTTYEHRPFEISMPDKAGYDLMRSTFASLGRPTGPDGEFFVIKVYPAEGDQDSVRLAGASPAKDSLGMERGPHEPLKSG